MKRVLFVILMFVLLALLVSCTENQRAKNWGGSARLELPVNQKLVNVTWKEDNLWYLTRPMTENDVAETYNFNEESSWGVAEGTYTIVETKE